MAPSAITSTEEYTTIPIRVSSQYDCLTHRQSQKQNGISPKDLVEAAFLERINTINHNVCEAGEDDAFFVADMGEVYRQHLRWKLNLPRVKPHYGNLFPCEYQITLSDFGSGQM